MLSHPSEDASPALGALFRSRTRRPPPKDERARPPGPQHGCGRRRARGASVPHLRALGAIPAAFAGGRFAVQACGHGYCRRDGP